MKIIEYENYLTEEKLGKLLGEVFDGEEVLPQYSIKGRYNRFRVDFFIPRLGIVVEFNGNTHYQKTKVILRDYALREYCKENNLKLIEIPYWLQIDDRVFHLLFGLQLTEKFIDSKVEFKVNYPHGFISKDCVLPADFSADGWNRFWKEYTSLLENPDFEYFSVLQEIFDSLSNRIDLVGVEPVMGIDLGNSNSEGSKAFFLANYPT
jgi:hypothetical protein